MKKGAKEEKEPSQKRRKKTTRQPFDSELKSKFPYNFLSKVDIGIAVQLTNDFGAISGGGGEVDISDVDILGQISGLFVFRRCVMRYGR